MPRTALIVPVPEAADYYDALVGVPAHVTILVPFLEPDAIEEHEVAEVLGSFGSFTFDLVAVEEFLDGTRWLRPEPMARFRSMTEAVWRRWPDRPPYGGAHDVVTPHVTVTREPVMLPIRARASCVLLLEEQDDDSWVTRRSFALAQGVA
jgi:2'-5' RNA ligase superfamily protein